MAYWDWYPYDTYCASLAGHWLWGGAGPSANLANAGSTFSVKFAESVYNAYRKGGWTLAETFKDCVAQRYSHRGLVEIRPGFAPDASTFAAELAFRLIGAVARAKADAAAESKTAALREGMQYVARETVAPEGRLRALLTTPMVPLSPLSPLGPHKPMPMPSYPAAAELGELFTNRSWQGYEYRAFADVMTTYITAELDMMTLAGDVTINAGAVVSGKLLGWVGGVVPAGGDGDDWALGQKAEGKAVLIGSVDTAQQGLLGDLTREPAVGDAYAVATRDISVVSSICQRDPTAAVLYEPRDGWVEPSADDLAKGKEAGVGLPKWALYAGAVAVLSGAGYLAYQAGKKG